MLVLVGLAKPNLLGRGGRGSLRSPSIRAKPGSPSEKRGSWIMGIAVAAAAVLLALTNHRPRCPILKQRGLLPHKDRAGGSSPTQPPHPAGAATLTILGRVELTLTKYAFWCVSLSDAPSVEQALGPIAIRCHESLSLQCGCPAVA